MLALALRRSSSCNIMYSRSSQVWQRCAGLTTCQSFYSSSVGFQTSKGRTLSFALSKHKGFHPSTGVTSVSSTGYQLLVGLSTHSRRMSLRLSVPTHKRTSRVTWNVRHIPWRVGGACGGLYLSFSTSGPVYAEAANNDNKEFNASSISSSHGKQVYTNYSITGIPGDGRCLFRSVVYGACIRTGKPLPNENLQRELADDLRSMVADEFVRRRSETEWFVEGDFDTYVSQIRKPHVWGGEPELFMASHVLQMPITVYMLDEDAGGLIAIAEYGQEYGKEDPIQVLYHGFGHYDALQIPGRQGTKSRI